MIEWAEAGEFTDIKYHKTDGIAKITINRPEVRNAFRPLTVEEMIQALDEARNDPTIGVVILTGEGKEAFCSGGDQKVRGDSGYKDAAGVHRLNVLDFQRQMRSCPMPIIAMVAGYAVGGGHVLHVMCDLTIAADNAIFGQTGPRVGSFDGGYGATYLARIVGQKKAREIWYLCRQYNAQEALDMGLVNTVVPDSGYKDAAGVHRLNVLDFQRQMRSCPMPIIAMVAGYAVGGGHVLHVMCDLTIAADNAIFGQTGPRVGSFDGGYGATYLARIVGQKKAREIWYLCRQYNAQEALDMGLVNTVVPYERLEEETVQWCREILAKSPIAIRCLKAAFNADTDGQAGLQELAGNATMLFYMTEEGQEGRNAFVEKRQPDFSKFPRRP